MNSDIGSALLCDGHTVRRGVSIDTATHAISEAGRLWINIKLFIASHVEENKYPLANNNNKKEKKKKKKEKKKKYPTTSTKADINERGRPG